MPIPRGETLADAILCRPVGDGSRKLIYDPLMEADFGIELGGDDETLELPWESDGGPRYYDVKRRPELLLHIEEGGRVPELGEFLAAVNAAESLVESAKCDYWWSIEINPEEEIFGTAGKFGSYIDLLFSNEAARFSLASHEQFARQITQLLKQAEEMAAAAEFLIRRAYFHAEDRIQEGFYFTFYLFGYGDDEAQARQRWAIALKVAEDAICQLSRAE